MVYHSLWQIDHVEFERHGGAGATGMSSHYFDLILRLKSDQEHQFRNIPRNEYHNLYDLIRCVQTMCLSPTKKLLQSGRSVFI